MSSFSKKSKSVLGEIKSLVENLSDRDSKLKKDFRLFEDFFEHFPIPVSMWSSNIDGEILSVKDKGFFCKDASNIKDLFDCPSICSLVLEDHEQAIEGKNTQRILEKEEKTYFVSIVARRDDKESIIGASGIAWDVSSNMGILSILKSLKERLETNSISSDEILKCVVSAIDKSRLNKLLSGDM